MNKKTLIIVLAGLLIVIGLVWVGFKFINDSKELTISRRVNEADKIVLYSSAYCPFCKILDEYIEKNKITDQISFITKYVDYNRENATELTQKATTCGFPANQVGVPFLWDSGRCYVGSDEIIAFFENQLFDLSNQQ